MTKVCHMTSVHREEDVRIFHKECVSLAKAGYEVYLVAPGVSYEKNGVHIVGLGQPPAGRIKRMIAFTALAYKTALALDADIYHFHDPELLPYGLKLKKRGKIVIFDCHENTLEAILEKAWIPSSIRKIAYHGYKHIQESICQQLDAVITVTPHIVDYFHSINPNTVQIANFPIIRDSPLSSRSENTLVFAGGISSQWNHHTLLQAMEQVPQAHYLLCGHGEPTYLQKLQALPAWTRTQYMGHISHEEIFNIMAQAQIGIALLSYNRNSGWKTGTMGNTKIFEEMMMGLPVICTDFTLWREFVDAWHCGICVDPEDPDAIAAAIQYLLGHPDEAREMGKNGRNAVKMMFNWHVEEKKLLLLYQEVLKNASKA